MKGKNLFYIVGRQYLDRTTIDNDDLMEEVRSRGLDEVELIEPTKEELRKCICQVLNINEMYDDEEIFEMLRELWKTSKYISKR